LEPSEAEISGLRRYLPAALRERHFALLFWGQATSFLGDWLFAVALPFAALSLGATTTQVGLVLAAQLAPFLFLTLIGGASADRLERRRVMLACDAVRAVTQAVAGVLLVTGSAELWELAALAAVYGSADAFFAPASVGLVPATVRPELVQDANALLGLSRNATRFVGAPLGGVLVAAFGPGQAILVDAATFVVSAALLARMRVPAPERAEQAEPTLRAIKAGWREVRRQPWIARFLVVFVVYHACVVAAVFVLGPVLADEQLDGARSWGLIQGGFAVGAIAGGLIALRWRPRRAPLAIAIALMISSLQAAFIALGATTLVIAALVSMSGAGIVVAIALWETTIQQRVPEHLLSRVISFDFLTSAGSMPIGMALVGPVAGAVGLEEALIGASALGVLAAAVYALGAR
jgi:predicted MFS family arabinose efflux permease